LLVKTELVEAISKQIAAGYKKRTKIGATIFVSRPTAGATGDQGVNLQLVLSGK
jgi:hypothetical protein